MTPEIRMMLFFGAFIAGAPLIARSLVRRPSLLPLLLAAFAVIAQLKLDLVFFSVDELDGSAADFAYRGYQRGLEVTGADALALAAAIALPFIRRSSLRLGDPQLLLLSFYALTVGVSIFVAFEPHFAAWEFIRCVKWIAIFAVLLNLVKGLAEVRTLLLALGFVVLMETAWAVIQRYGMRVHRVPGSYAHPNSLGMATNLVFPFLVAGIFALPRRLAILAGIAAGGAFGTVVCTLSRGALGVMAGTSLLTSALTIGRIGWHRAAPRLACILLFVLPLWFKAQDNIIARFKHASPAPLITRQLQAEVAKEIIANHPMGTGANNFARAAQRYVRYTGDYPGSLDDNPGPVHNAILLETAETGWFGLLALFALGLCPFLRGLRIYLQGTRDTAWMGAAIMTSSLGYWASSTLEWVYKQTPVFTTFLLMCVVAARLDLITSARMLRSRRRSFAS